MTMHAHERISPDGLLAGRMVGFAISIIPDQEAIPISPPLNYKRLHSVVIPYVK